MFLKYMFSECIQISTHPTLDTAIMGVSKGVGEDILIPAE